jgi:hypothetical protein
MTAIRCADQESLHKTHAKPLQNLAEQRVGSMYLQVVSSLH